METPSLSLDLVFLFLVTVAMRLRDAGDSSWGCRREVISWVFGSLGGSRQGNEQACSGQEWVKPCKLLADRTWPWSLCLKEGGSQAAPPRQSQPKLRKKKKKV